MTDIEYIRNKNKQMIRSIGYSSVEYGEKIFGLASSVCGSRTLRDRMVENTYFKEDEETRKSVWTTTIA
jgi:hypothetical protein